ncbi:MAG TPA: hypothetical protein VFQ53_37700 [Kofleriaceae bacterium]|nr:hypothetical protein [Kofleriaceae bacterium]
MRLAIAVLLAIANVADARVEPTHDLASLVAQSESVVLAQPLAPGRFRLHQVLRGRAVPAEFELETLGYPAVAPDQRVVLFLRRSHGTLRLVPSGMRIITGGMVARLDQPDSPGPYVAVDWGEGPTELWASQQLTWDELAAAIAEAGRTVDAFGLAVLERDPGKRRAAILALFPYGRQSAGFSPVDTLGRLAARVLDAAGDREGALLVAHRRQVAELAFSRDELLAFARDPTRDDETRIAAIEMLEVDDRAEVVPLVDDPRPRVRAAAARTVVRIAKHRVRARLAHEADPRVRNELAFLLDRRGVQVSPDGRRLEARVSCAIARTSVQLVARRAGVAYDVDQHLSAQCDHEGRSWSRVAAPLAPGTYELVVVDGGHQVGTVAPLDVDPRGELTIPW